jgi:glutathione S-transferase
LVGSEDSRIRETARRALSAYLQVWRAKSECAIGARHLRCQDEVDDGEAHCMTDNRYRLIGSTASPYAIKLRALMRYRRIPHDWVIMTKALRAATAHLKPMLIPVLQYPDGSYRGETTTLAHDLEARHQGRSVIPRDKAVAFIGDLLEDLADEWAVKPLFLYRWWDPEDQGYVSRWAAEEWSTSDAEAGSPEEIAEFRQRQISRMVILGATAENKPLLEESYRRILAAFEPHVGMDSYLFGSRPSLADFAWFGQLSEMATDPTPMRIMRERAPFTDHWVRRLADASGVEGAWSPREQALGGLTEALLRIAGELYLPFLAANADAFAKELNRLEINVWGLPYALAPFKYQVKCLQQIREKFAALGADSRVALKPVLERTGCWAILAGR